MCRIRHGEQVRRTDEFQRWISDHSGVFTRADALRCGISPKRFRVGVASGEWVRFRGVWRLADFPPSAASHVWAVLLRAGPRARVSGPTSLWFHGLRVRGTRIYISVPESRHVVVDGAVIIRDRRPDDGGVYVEGIPSVTRQRAVVDSLRLLPPTEGREVLHEALRRGWVDLGYLDQSCRDLKGHRGLVNLRRQTAYAHSGSRAESERVLLRLLRRRRLTGWRFNVAIHDRYGRLIGVGDCVHEASGIVVEVDGRAWHSTAQRFQRDRTRQNMLANGDWHILRFTWEDLTQRPAAVMASIEAALALRSSRR